MIDKENRVEVSNGRKTRWVLPNELADYASQGYAQVGEVQVVLKPRKKQVEPAVESAEPTEMPTTEETSNG